MAEQRAKSQGEPAARTLGRLLEHVPFAVFQLDRHLRFVFVSQAAQSIIGLSPVHFTGKTPSEAGVDANLWQPIEAACREVIDGGERRQLGVSRDTAEGRRYYDVWLSPRRNARGRIDGVVGTLADATDRWQTEVALRESEDRFRGLLDWIEDDVRREAEGAIRLKEEFLATLSHELRSPLNAILGWAHIGHRYAAGQAELERAFETIERNARAQAQIVDDLLDMRHIVTAAVSIKLELVRPQEVIASALEAIRPAAQARRLTLECSLDPKAQAIETDPRRLRQALVKLLDNAVKFTPAHGCVSVTLTQSDSHVLIAVRDTGIGIEPDVLPFVFEHFRQADSSTTRRHGGVGLGLSIVRSLMELLGGAIQAASTGVGQGTTFTISLPRTDSTVEAHRPAGGDGQSPKSASSSWWSRN